MIFTDIPLCLIRLIEPTHNAATGCYCTRISLRRGTLKSTLRICKDIIGYDLRLLLILFTHVKVVDRVKGIGLPHQIASVPLTYKRQSEVTSLFGFVHKSHHSCWETF